MISETQPRLCVACKKPFRGRSDKKYCDDLCRNNYNNQQKACSNNLVRNINNALSINRRALESLVGPGEEMGRATRDMLLQKGFRFPYATHRVTNNNGNTYTFCYDYGYLQIAQDTFLVVKDDENLVR